MFGNRLRGYGRLSGVFFFVGCAAAVASPSELRRGLAATPPNRAEQLAKSGLRYDLSGDSSKREAELRAALAKNPDCELARWHSGFIKVGDNWVTIADAEKTNASVPSMSEYRRRRDAIPANDATAELELANWCRKNGLAPQEQLHLARVLRSTDRTSTQESQASSRLGLQRVGNEWLTKHEAQQRQKQADAAAQGRRDWQPLAQRLRNAYSKKGIRAREHWSDELKKVSDVAAISVLEAECSLVHADLSELLVRWLSRMPQHEAAVSLVRQAVLSPFPKAADEATIALGRREKHDYLPTLLNGLVAPIESAFQVTPRDDGTVLHVHLLQRRGAEQTRVLQQTNLMGTRDELQQARPLRQARPQGVRRQNAEPIMQPDDRAFASQRAVSIETDVARFNAGAAQQNNRVLAVLQKTTGQTLAKDSPTDWWEWWQTYNDMYYAEKPTYVAQYSQAIEQPLPISAFGGASVAECFVAGTPVRTSLGPANIESIRPGDLVLSQNPETGELSYKLVMNATTRPPRDLLAIDVAGESFTCTPGHPYWVIGSGWRLAKELRVGDRIHTVQGGRTIAAITSAAPAATYNLVVAEFGTYFVGTSNVLVHDGTWRRPTNSLVPGLARTTAPSLR